jgi:hypothetical protein
MWKSNGTSTIPLIFWLRELGIAAGDRSSRGVRFRQGFAWVTDHGNGSNHHDK